MAATLVKVVLVTCVAVSSMFGQVSSSDLEKHTAAAQEAQAKQDFKTAIAEYELLLRSMPRSAELMSNLGVAYYFDQQFDKAAAVCRKAIALKPQLEAPHLFLGLAMYHLSNPDAAGKELKEAVHLQPSDILAHLWLGYSYVAQSRYEDARAEFQEATKLQPENIDAWYALGQTNFEIGKEKAQKLLEVAPNGGRVWQLAGEQFAMNGDAQKASNAFAEAHHRRADIPADGKADFNNGSVEDALYFDAHGAEQEAKDAFQHVLEQAPDSARAHQIAADAYFAQQQFGKAVEEYRRVLASDPALPGIHLQISNSLMIEGQFAQALHECRQEEKLQPRSSQVQMALGRILLAMGQDAAAATALQRSLSLDRPSLETYFLLAKAELRTGREREAIPLLQHYIASQPDDSNGYYLLSRAYRAAGDTEQMEHALALYQKTSKDVKERNVAQAALRSQGSEKALQQLDEADASEQP
ncbi:MAG TPA: tetratricopeptide repeat protein [Alloacidobacterium sp.]|nr:tetratricopeptide repeat protein [Alloacidobacterium sp.]